MIKINDDTKVKIVLIIFLSLIAIAGFIMIAWINSPDAILTIKFDATDKGIEFIKAINYTMN